MRIEKLIDSQLQAQHIGSPGWFHYQRQVFDTKPLVKELYLEWYRLLLDDEASVPGSQKGGLLELGSGPSFLKEFKPGLITSDVEPGIADQVIDARTLPFEDQSLRAIFMTHVFHHVPEVEKFLTEAERTLVPGGVISMIEISHTPFSRFFYSTFSMEYFNDRAKDWNFAQSNAMRDANQALSWIVFVRDRNLLRQKFPSLEVEVIEYLPCLGYLLSAGMIGKSIVPTFALSWVRFLERMLKPLRPLFSIHWHIRVRKKMAE